MFKALEEKWTAEAKRASRWTVYRAWIGTGIVLLVVLIVYLEKVLR